MTQHKENDSLRRSNRFINMRFVGFLTWTSNLLLLLPVLDRGDSGRGKCFKFNINKQNCGCKDGLTLIIEKLCF